MSKIVVYVATHCQPCQVVKELLEKGHFLVNGKETEVELVDIETDEGFNRIFPELEGVPSAYQEGKKCSIHIEEDTLFLECQDAKDQRA